MEDLVDLLSETAAALPKDAAWLGTGLVLLVAARFVKDLLTPYKLREQMTKHDNPAIGMSVAGYYVGVLLVCIGPMLTDTHEDIPWWVDLLYTAAYAAGGIVLLNVARVVLDRALLYRFSTSKELVDDRNPGMGAVEGGAYVASGLVVAGSLHGHGGGPHTALLFFTLGQVLLVLYGHLYRVVCRYDVFAEIEKDNVAAGVAFALNLVAMGVVLMRAASGDFVDWVHNLGEFGIVTVLGAVMLVILRVLVDLLLLPGVKVRDEIVDDRNANVAWVEGAVLTGMAGLLVSIL
ncbi:MAG TPA: DUF350 domain-containing protein [Sandaracinaceae bacterium LLY-WYZ-13_1]|nr:DUF350 domain-containing protein [Sandaracinaceae bacterium LLY-WYZ-13_1]